MPMQHDEKPVENAPKVRADMVHQFCMAIQLYEGWIIPGGKDAAGMVYPNGSPAYRNKNPGNLRCINASRAGWNILAVGCNNNFCVFPTYEIGFQAMVNVVLSAAQGHSLLYNAHARNDYGLADASEMNLVQYFTVRDPASDGNIPHDFANFVAKQLDVDSEAFHLKDLLG